jgi:hypothetical protein
MSYLGRLSLGDYVPLMVACYNGSYVPAEPSAAPTAKIFDAAGSLVETVNMPIRDRYRRTGFFMKPHRLSSSYSAGRYQIVYEYTAGSARAKAEWFDVIGGNADGSVIAATEFAVPDSRYVVYEADGGKLFAGRNAG